MSMIYWKEDIFILVGQNDVKWNVWWQNEKQSAYVTVISLWMICLLFRNAYHYSEKIRRKIYNLTYINNSLLYAAINSIFFKTLHITILSRALLQCLIANVY